MTTTTFRNNAITQNVPLTVILLFALPPLGMAFAYVNSRLSTRTRRIASCFSMLIWFCAIEGMNAAPR